MENTQSANLAKLSEIMAGCKAMEVLQSEIVKTRESVIVKTKEFTHQNVIISNHLIRDELDENSIDMYQVLNIQINGAKTTHGRLFSGEDHIDIVDDAIKTFGLPICISFKDNKTDRAEARVLAKTIKDFCDSCKN